jgi:hypothetical protein
MLTSKIMVRRNEEDMSVKVECQPEPKVIFFRGHIKGGANLEQAFAWIREAITQVGKLKGAA